MQSRFESSLLLTKEQVAAMGVAEEDRELFIRAKYHESFNMDKWYESMIGETFRSVVIPLTASCVGALYRANRCAVAVGRKRPAPSADDKKELKELEDKLNGVIRREFPLGAFVKLGSRSPKDVPYNEDVPRVKELLASELRKVYAELMPELELRQDSKTKQRFAKIEKQNKEVDNVEMLAYMRALGRFLVVRDGATAVDLILRSERTYYNLRKVNEFPSGLLTTSIVLREWVPELPYRLAYEFRGFVYKNRLNALTQYCDFCYSEEMLEEKEEVANRIRTFFEEKMKGKLFVESYVADFYVAADRVWLLELNPFHNASGGCLFTWADDRERFLNGPFEFRVRGAYDELARKEWLPKHYSSFCEQWRKKNIMNVKVIPNKSYLETMEEETRSQIQVPRRVRGVLYSLLCVAIVLFLWLLWGPLFGFRIVGGFSS